MVCHPCQAAVTQSEAAYRLRMRRAGPYYWERQRVWVHCMACGEEMAVELLVVLLQMHQGNVEGGRKNWKTTAPSEEPCTYRMAFPTAGGPWNCTIKGFLGRASPRMAMRDHLFHWHVQDTVIILEEGNPPPPTVHPVQHSGALEFTEWEAPCHLPVRQGGGEEAPTADIRGDVGDYREGLPGL